MRKEHQPSLPSLLWDFTCLAQEGGQQPLQKGRPLVGGAGVAQPILDPPPGHWTCDLTSPDHSQQVLTCVAFTGKDKLSRAIPGFSCSIPRSMGPKVSTNNGTAAPPGREVPPGNRQAAQLATPSCTCP